MNTQPASASSKRTRVTPSTTYVDEVFERAQRYGTFLYLLIPIQDHLKPSLAKTEERIISLVNLEDKPFSLITHYLADYTSKFLAYYRGTRHKNNHADIMDTINMYMPPSPSTTNSKHGTPVVSKILKVLSGLVEIGFNGTEAHDLAKLLKADKMEPALEIMAEVRAYFQGGVS